MILSAHRPVFLLVAGQAFSKLAVALYLLSMTLYIRNLSGSAGLLGLLQFLSLAPIVVLSPIGATLADLRGAKAVMLISDAGRGLVLLALALLLSLTAHASSAYGVLAVLFTALLVGIGQATFQPAADAFLPNLVKPSSLGAAVGLRGAVVQSANLAGNAFGGIAFLALGAAGSIGVTALLFLLSAAWETLLPSPLPARRSWKQEPLPMKSPQPQVRRLFQRLVIQTRLGLRFARRTHGLSALLVMNVCFHASFPVLLIALPFFLEFELGLGPEYLGYSFAALLAGGILGYTLIAVLRPKVDHRMLAVLLAINAPSLWLLSATADYLPKPVAVYFVALLLAGAAAAGVHLVVHTAIGLGVEQSFRARVFGLLEASTGAAAAFGFLFAGPVLDLLMERLPAVLATLGVFALLLSVVPLRRRSIRNFLLSSKLKV